MTNTRMYRFALLAGVALVATVGCSEGTQDSMSTDMATAVTAVGDAMGETADNAAEMVARNFAAQQGEDEFADAGYVIDGELECTADITDGRDAIVINCTGVTEEGGAAALTGTTDELPGASVVSLSGSFIGTVDGAEVFNTDQLGG